MMPVVNRYFRRVAGGHWQQIDAHTYHRRRWSFGPFQEGEALARVYVPAECAMKGEAVYWIEGGSCEIKGTTATCIIIDDIQGDSDVSAPPPPE